MRIAFDLDGVLADLHAPFVKAAVKLFPELDAAAIRSADVGASPPDTPVESPDGTTDAQVEESSTQMPLTHRQSDAVWRHIATMDDFWEGLDEIEPGAIARLATLADERRWEVLFITSRPRSGGRTVQRQTQRWLDRLGFPMPSVYVVHGSRGRIAEALQIDMVVDDRPENCLDVVLESKAGALLVWRGRESSVPASARRLGIAVVPTVAACLDALVEAEQASNGGSLLDRLRRLFGLRTGPATSPGR